MVYFKELLLDKLALNDWELIEINDNTDWWLESYWKLRSVRQNYGLEIYVLFLVVPDYFGEEKEKAVWSIGAFDSVPLTKPNNEGFINTFFC